MSRPRDRFELDLAQNRPGLFVAGISVSLGLVRPLSDLTVLYLNGLQVEPLIDLNRALRRSNASICPASPSAKIDALTALRANQWALCAAPRSPGRPSPRRSSASRRCCPSGRRPGLRPARPARPRIVVYALTADELAFGAEGLADRLAEAVDGQLRSNRCLRSNLHSPVNSPQAIARFSLLVRRSEDTGFRSTP